MGAENRDKAARTSGWLRAVLVGMLREVPDAIGRSGSPPRGEPAEPTHRNLFRPRVKIAIFPDLGPSVKGFCGNRTANESRTVFIAERFGSLVLALAIVVLALVVVAFVLIAF